MIALCSDLGQNQLRRLNQTTNAFEWLHTVDRALETFPEAAALGTPPWRLARSRS